MKPILLFILLLIFYNAVKATECVDRVFKADKVNVHLCQNYSNYHETTSLLFKARTTVLSTYIQERIKTGQLKDKLFEIYIYDQVLTYQHLELKKDQNAYVVNLSGYPTLQQLATFVDYFTKADWKPFVTGDYQKVSHDIISKQIEQFFSDNSPSPLTAIPQDTPSIWRKGDLHLDYFNDQLKYYIGSTPLSIRPTSSLPVNINDRVILFQSDSIFVLKGRDIILQIKIDKPIEEDYDIYTFNQWVNICNGGQDNWVYSYSYDKNKFFKRYEQYK